MSLRIEKGYGSWSREYSPEYWPQESGLERLVKMDKGDFLNREAYAAIAAKPAQDNLVMVRSMPRMQMPRAVSQFSCRMERRSDRYLPDPTGTGS
jgi:glycine cleavage system aminomethyltransferase T